MLSFDEASGYFLKNHTHIQLIYRKAINAVLHRFPSADEFELIKAVYNSPSFVFGHPNVTLKNIDRYIFKYSYVLAMLSCGRFPLEPYSEYAEHLVPERILLLFNADPVSLYPLLASGKWINWSFIFAYTNCKSNISLNDFLLLIPNTQESKVLDLLLKGNNLQKISKQTRFSKHHLKSLISNICRTYMLALLGLPYKRHLISLNQRLSFCISNNQRTKRKASPRMEVYRFLELPEPERIKLVVQTWQFDIAYKVLKQCIRGDVNKHYFLRLD